MHGFDDTVVAGWDQGAPVRNVDPANDFPEGPSHHFFMDRFTEAFRAELAAFVEVAKGNAAPAGTVADAVEVAWLAEAATESLKRGAPVRLEDVKHDEDRRCADLVGGVRGTRMGIPAHAGAGARRDARRRNVGDRTRAGGLSAV